MVTRVPLLSPRRQGRQEGGGAAAVDSGLTKEEAKINRRMGGKDGERFDFNLQPEKERMTNCGEAHWGTDTHPAFPPRSRKPYPRVLQSQQPREAPAHRLQVAWKSFS
uniref:Uncharacterized protein n=1 Tax=Knipowitschia caucasica TaxID=637954 RepID=A0AAV2K518_KNICA